jgi:hypothetical protein
MQDVGVANRDTLIGQRDSGAQEQVWFQDELGLLEPLAPSQPPVRQTFVCAFGQPEPSAF